MRNLWRELTPTGLLTEALYARVSERLDEQVRCAAEWRDQINAYFERKSGVPARNDFHPPSLVAAKGDT